MPRTSAILLVSLALGPAAARAQELDSVLPAAIPGYGTPFGVAAAHPAREGLSPGFILGGVTVSPQAALALGVDTAPNGAAGSPLVAFTPSLLAVDPVAGFAAFGSADIARYPADSAQNLAGAALAMGERAVLPGEVVTVSGGVLNTQETGFALDSLSLSRPVRFTLYDIRASDAVALGMFTLTPAVSATVYSFPSLSEQDRTDTREGATLADLPGGPVQLLLRLQAAQAEYHAAMFDADTQAVLAGLVDTADGLWTLSVLAGVAQRRPRQGGGLTAPVLEAGLDWRPSDLGQLRLTVAHEIDDPDEVSAAPYTLTQAKIVVTEDVPDGAVLKFSGLAASADYIHSALRETLYRLDAHISWPFGPYLAVEGDYAFNDRQANYLSAANEHVVTLGIAWTP